MLVCNNCFSIRLCVRVVILSAYLPVFPFPLVVGPHCQLQPFLFVSTELSPEMNRPGEHSIQQAQLSLVSEHLIVSSIVFLVSPLPNALNIHTSKGIRNVQNVVIVMQMHV